MSDTATYVYAVGRDLHDALVRGLTGVTGGAVRLVRGSGLQGVASDVDRAEFEARALEERLEDLEWLATTARAHHHVVDTLGRAAPVAPLSLATVYYGDERVREVLDAGRDAFAEVLDRVTGRAEWGVKAFARARAAGSEERPRSGAEYLRARRRALREGDDVLAAAERAAEDLDAAVAAHAVDTRRHRLHDAGDRMVLNGAYLVAEEAAERLAEVVDSSADHERLRVEVTGPWVPYSFAELPARPAGS